MSLTSLVMMWKQTNVEKLDKKKEHDEGVFV